MPRYIDARDLRKRWDDRAIGPQRTFDTLCESLDAGRAGKPGGLKLEDFSIRNLFEELVPDGHRIMRLMEGSRRGRHQTPLLEATGAVDTSAFSSIVGQLAFSQILMGFDAPEFIWSRLSTTVGTRMIYGEKIPGVAGLGDVSEEVGEDELYPLVGTNEEYVEVGRLKKYGFRVNVTREIVITDNTGLVVTRCNDASRTLGYRNEKDCLDLATGAVSNYKRNGTANNTYLTSGAYVNTKASNALNDWTNINNIRVLQSKINDPNTGEPILLGTPKLLVPFALEATAKRVQTATSIEHVDNQANASTVRTTSGNPIPTYEVLTSQYVDRRTSSDSTWFMGDFARAIQMREAWAIEQDQLGQGSQLNFERDTLYQFKGSMMRLFQMMEPRYLAKSTA